MERTITDKVVIGTRIHSILYGGRDGVIYDIKGELSPGTIRSLFGGMMQTGSRADIYIVFDNGTKSVIPECILRGVQWRIYTDVVGPDVIAAMLEFETIETARKKVEAEKAAEAFAAAVEAVKVNPAFAKLLKSADTSKGGGVHVAKNIRIELKAKWPAVKFKITSEYDSVNINWQDGPTTNEVKAITGKYEGGHFNGMEDIYEYNRSPFTAVFGDVKYIFENRHFSEQALKAAAEFVAKNYGWNPEHFEVLVSGYDGHAHLGNSTDRDDSRKVYAYLEQEYPYNKEEAARLKAAKEATDVSTE